MIKIKPKQLLFDLNQAPAFSREDFLVMPSNSAAVSLIDEWPNWPSYGAVLVGPEGSGKSHLAHAWASKSQGNVLAYDDLDEIDFSLFEFQPALCIEDAPSQNLDETHLFHILNLVKQAGASLLLTTTSPPEKWLIKLPDLNSRLQALPVVQLMPPDDLLLRSVLVKQFMDRQIAVDEAIVSYMVLRMPRSLAIARKLVFEIDRRALQDRAEVTRPFVAKVMSENEVYDLFT